MLDSDEPGTQEDGRMGSEVGPRRVLSRRSFVNLLLGAGVTGWLASVVYPVLKFLIPPEETGIEPEVMNLGPLDGFPPGSSKIFRFGRKPVLLVRTQAGALHALAATCTHLDCLVQYRADLDAVWCACHNGKYDLTGRNISGPPPKPLDQYAVKAVGGQIMVGKHS
ncbi:MAG: Rieske 2Fe-2S domain-containing protein [Elusimicrobiota bacterium]